MFQNTNYTPNKYKKRLERVLDGTGIAFNGPEPWDISVHNTDLYKRLFAQGSVGFGESYMDGWWDCEELDKMFTILLSVNIKDRMAINAGMLLDLAQARLSNQQNISKASGSVGKNYDLGNDLFRAMLDPELAYSCGYWKNNATTVADAQLAKFDLICRKLGLREGQRVLDIGCGWGGLLKYMCTHYKVSAVGITLSKEQMSIAKKGRCTNLPVEIRLEDYRVHTGAYDHIVSVGMFEHVGVKNCRTFLEVVRKCLKSDGLFLLHTIGLNKSMTAGDPWLRKYVFPGYMLPSIKQVGDACERLFVVEDVHNFGPDYDKTLMAWYHNFSANWEQIQARYDERFYRMWKYYLLSYA